jgi:hypothetical protein
VQRILEYSGARIHRQRANSKIPQTVNEEPPRRAPVPCLSHAPNDLSNDDVVGNGERTQRDQIPHEVNGYRVERMNQLTTHTAQ